MQTRISTQGTSFTRNVPVSGKPSSRGEPAWVFRGMPCFAFVFRGEPQSAERPRTMWSEQDEKPEMEPHLSPGSFGFFLCPFRGYQGPPATALPEPARKPSARPGHASTRVLCFLFGPVRGVVVKWKFAGNFAKLK